MLKRVGKAFLTGGVIGAVGQVLIMFTSMFIADPAMASMAGILLFGFIAVGLIISGIYFKVAKFGDSGAAIPVCGLMFGAATGGAAAKKSGQTTSQAFLSGFKGVIVVVGIGFTLSALLGFLIG